MIAIRAAALVAMLAMALGAASCGEDDPGTPREQITAAVADLRESFDARDLEDVCAGMSRAARKQVEAAESGAAGSCERALGQLFDPRERSTSAERTGRRKVTKVKVKGGRAAVTVTLHERGPGRLSFVREDGEWKLDDVRAILPAADTQASTADSKFPDFPFKVSHENGSGWVPCPDLTRGGGAGGGCPRRVTTGDARLLMQSAFGDYEVARCRSSYDLHLDGRGHFKVDNVEFGGDAPCDEFKPCKDGEAGLRYPWKGHIHGGGLNHFLQHIDLCLHTPFGRVDGRLFKLVTYRGGDWKAKADDFPLGDSGFEFQGVWDIEPDGLRMRDPGRKLL